MIRFFTSFSFELQESDFVAGVKETQIVKNDHVVADIGQNGQVFTERKERVNVRLTVSVMANVEVERDEEGSEIEGKHFELVLVAEFLFDSREVHVQRARGRIGRFPWQKTFSLALVPVEVILMVVVVVDTFFK